MFAHHGIARSQLSQNERGDAIEISRGNRYATEFAKLPITAPSTKASDAPTPLGR